MMGGPTVNIDKLMEILEKLGHTIANGTLFHIDIEL